MKNLFIIASCLGLALSGTAQVASHAPTMARAEVPALSASRLDQPAVRVNGTVLTQRDLVRQMMNQFPYARQHGGRFPKEIEGQIRKDALQQIEFEELVYQETQRRKMTVPPSKLSQAIRDFKQQFDSEADFQNFVKQEQGGSMDRLRKNIRRAILIDQFLNAEVSQKAVPSSLEVRNFYEANRERFRKPDSVSLQTISLVIPDDATAPQKAEIRKRAEDLLQQAKAAKGYEAFGVLAEKYSQDDWRVMMGDHKTIHRGRMPPQVEKVVFTMQAGQVSDIIETENSFCIARVNAREDSRIVPLEEMKPQLKKELQDRRRNELRRALEAKLRKGAKIEEL